MPAWSPPVTTWAAGNGISHTALIRIEQNTKDLRDAVYRRVQGFGYQTGIGLTYLNINAGSCFSEDYYPLNFTGGLKSMAAHALGFGSSIGCLAPTVTLTANTWYYIFALGHVSSSSVEIMLDTSPTGANVTLTNYPRKRYVGSVKTDGSSNLVEMFSTGDDVFINPNSMYNGSVQVTIASANVYQTATLQFAAGNFSLPAKDVRARLNMESNSGASPVALGLYSRMPDAPGTGLNFTIPASLWTGAVYRAEFLHLYKDVGASNYLSGDCDIMVNSSRQISIASQAGTPVVDIYVRGYTDLREL